MSEFVWVERHTGAGHTVKSALPMRLCALQVASRLWQLVVIDSRLVDHLAALKDYLLLAKGDFWTSFLVDAAKQLSRPAGTKVDLGEWGAA
jgi:hypothetical protein